MTTPASRFQFMESQAAHIEARIRMIQHGSIQYPELVGVDREASPYADVVLYYSQDGTGSMIDLANRGNDYPRVQVTQAQHSVPIHWKGLAYDYSDREIGRAMMLRENLPDRKIRQAFRIWEEEKDRVFIFGDSAKGWDGFINHSQISVENTTGTFESQPAEVIADDINSLLGGVWDGTNQVRIADTLCMTPAALNVLATKPMGNDANRNVLSYIRENNILTQTTGRPLMMRTLRQLTAAGVSGVDRMVGYARDMEVLRLHVPMELQFMEPQREADTWVYYGTAALAGLEIMEPGGMRYLDNT